MQLSIFGLDHVGAVSAGCLAAQGHSVIAVDRAGDKIAAIQRAVPPVNEPGLGPLIEEAVAAQRLRATTSLAEAIADSSLTSICGGTVDRHDRPDLSLVLALCEEIGGALRDKARFHAIIVRSALRPGSVRDFVIPALERASGKRAGVDFGVGIYPHFLRRGSAVEDYLNPPAMILGVTDDETLARLREMDIALEAPEMVVGLDEAEAMLLANLRAGVPTALKPLRPTAPVLA